MDRLVCAELAKPGERRSIYYRPCAVTLREGSVYLLSLPVTCGVNLQKSPPTAGSSQSRCFLPLSL